MRATHPSTPAAAIALVAAVVTVAVMAAAVTIVSPAAEPLMALARFEPAALAYECAPDPQTSLNPHPAQPI